MYRFIPPIPTLVAALTLAASPARALSMRDCDTPIANARNLSQPYDTATRSFANGSISLLYLLQDEPACCGAHLMVLFPATDDPFAQCRIVTTDDAAGWSSLALMDAKADYDAVRGLTVHILATEYDGFESTPFTLDVTINQATGTVAADTSLP